MVMIMHKCVLKDINKCLVKQSGERMWEKENAVLNKVKEISSRFLKSLKANIHSESLNRNKAYNVSKLFRPGNSFTKHLTD